MNDGALCDNGKDSTICNILLKNPSFASLFQECVKEGEKEKSNYFIFYGVIHRCCILVFGNRTGDHDKSRCF